MNTSVNELLSNPAFRPLVLLDVLAVFLMIICLVFRRMRKGYYVEQANDARKATMLNIAVRNVTGMGVYSAPGYWDNGDLNLCRFEHANGDIVPGAVEADGEGGLRGRSCRGSGLVLVRQSFIDIGHFRCLHFIQQVCIAGPNGWACFGTRILIAAALQ